VSTICSTCDCNKHYYYSHTVSGRRHNQTAMASRMNRPTQLLSHAIHLCMADLPWRPTHRSTLARMSTAHKASRCQSANRRVAARVRICIATCGASHAWAHCGFDVMLNSCAQTRVDDQLRQVRLLASSRSHRCREGKEGQRGGRTLQATGFHHAGLSTCCSAFCIDGADESARRREREQATYSS